MAQEPLDLYYDEIDLREYLRTLFKYKGPILALTVVAALLAFLISLLLPPTYQATAGVALVGSRVRVTFDPRIQTEEARIDIKARRQALVNLALSGDVIDEVIRRLGDRLNGDVTPEQLRRRVKAAEAGDFIRITVTWPRDPQLAADLANAWAEVYVQHANRLYGAPAEDLEQIQVQKDQAWEEYRQAQEALEAFLAESEIEALQLRIQELEAMVQALEGQRKEEFQFYYDRMLALEELRVQLEALRDQVAAGTDSPAGSAGDALAVLRARAQALGVDGQPALELRLEGLADLSGSVQARTADLDALLAQVEAAREAAAEQVKDLSGAPLEPGASLYGYEGVQELQQLRARLEAEQARQRELKQVRDRAWETYKALANKAEEVKIAARTAGAEVKVASRALVPREPASPKKLLNAALAGALGLLLGVFGAFFVEYWRQEGDERSA